MATPKQVLKISLRIVSKFPVVLLKGCEHVLGEGTCPKGELRVPGFCQTINGFQTKTFYGFRGLGLSPQGLIWGCITLSKIDNWHAGACI